MRQWYGAFLDQMMTYHLFGTKPLTTSTLTIKIYLYEILFECKFFIKKKCSWKCRLQNGGDFVPVSMCLIAPQNEDALLRILCVRCVTTQMYV